MDAINSMLASLGYEAMSIDEIKLAAELMKNDVAAHEVARIILDARSKS